MTDPDLFCLRKLTVDQLKTFMKLLGPQPGGTTSRELYTACRKILVEKDIPDKGVYIVTTCGEKKHYNPNQPIQKIYIEGEEMWDREKGFVI